MPKRFVRHLSWEVMSEQMADTPAMLRRENRYVIKQSLKELTRFESDANSHEDLWKLARAAFAAYHLKRYTQARVLVDQVIQAVNGNSDDTDESDATHIAHMVLGLLALQEENIGKAIDHLHASAKVKASPVLGSFGPRMMLARELLLRGRVDAVLAYFEKCRVFWSRGELWLEVWTAKIKKGRIPNFVMHLNF